MGSIPARGAIGSGGHVGYLRAFLCGVCMFSLCPQGVSSSPTEKTCKRTEHSPSVPDLTWSPGAAHCSWSPGGRTVRDGINAEDKSTNDLRPACVYPV